MLNKRSWMDGGSKNHNFDFSAISVPVGAHQYRICADANNVVPESIEGTDNCSSPWVPFTVAYSPEANLKVNGLDVPAQMNPGDTARVTWCDTSSTYSEHSCQYASSCTLSNGWSGLSGDNSEILFTNRTYTLTCQPNNVTDTVVVPVLQPYDIMLNKTGQGTVTSTNTHPIIGTPPQTNFSCDPTCTTQTKTFYQDTIVTFNFTASPGRIIVGITGCDGTPTYTGRTSASCGITVTGGRTVSVTFAIDPSYKEF
jgi:hypothetical protein